MKKNGFVSTTLIYAFFIIFITLMIFLLNSYSRNRYLLSTYKYDIKKSFAENNSKNSKSDINIYFMSWNNYTLEYELVNDLPLGFVLENELSSCKNGSQIKLINNKIVIEAKGKDTCYLYFKPTDSDITLLIYTKETINSPRIHVANIPGDDYKLTSSNCDNGGSITFNEDTRKFKIDSDNKTTCEVEFTKIEGSL